jgi:hypothetical protein
LIVIGWHNRRDPISAHEKTPNANVRNLSIKSDPLKPQLITADHSRRSGARKRSREAL